MSNQLRLLLLIVVISGALCTVEDYVIMSQCAHNKAIHLAAEGTVSATDISQTQNITIVGLPDYVNNDFKIALYAKETQRYLCFNENWKLVGMKELRDTCYFNETIVHGYFVFRSVVDLQRRVGFTHRGKAVGPKKNVNDACYLFTKIQADLFFHQHTNYFAPKSKVTSPISIAATTTTTTTATTATTAAATTPTRATTTGKIKAKQTTATATTTLSTTSAASATIKRTATVNKNKTNRNNNNNNKNNRNNGNRNNNNNNNNNNKFNHQIQQQQNANGGHSRNRTNLSSNSKRQQQQQQQQKQLGLRQQQKQQQRQQQQQKHHQVRHHHNDPNLIARRQQHEHKQKRRQRNRTRTTTTTTVNSVTATTPSTTKKQMTTIVSKTTPTTTTKTSTVNAVVGGDKLKALSTNSAQMKTTAATPTYVVHNSTVTSPSTTTTTTTTATKATIAHTSTTTVANKRKSRRRKGEHAHKKTSHQQQLQHSEQLQLPPDNRITVIKPTLATYVADNSGATSSVFDASTFTATFATNANNIENTSNIAAGSMLPNDTTWTTSTKMMTTPTLDTFTATINDFNVSETSLPLTTTITTNATENVASTKAIQATTVKAFDSSMFSPATIISTLNSNNHSIKNQQQLQPTHIVDDTPTATTTTTATYTYIDNWSTTDTEETESDEILQPTTSLLNTTTTFVDSEFNMWNSSDIDWQFSNINNTASDDDNATSTTSNENESASNSSNEFSGEFADVYSELIAPSQSASVFENDNDTVDFNNSTINKIEKPDQSITNTTTTTTISDRIITPTANFVSTLATLYNKWKTTLQQLDERNQTTTTVPTTTKTAITSKTTTTMSDKVTNIESERRDTTDYTFSTSISHTHKHSHHRNISHGKDVGQQQQQFSNTDSHKLNRHSNKLHNNSNMNIKPTVVTLPVTTQHARRTMLPTTMATFSSAESNNDQFTTISNNNNNNENHNNRPLLSVDKHVNPMQTNNTIWELHMPPTSATSTGNIVRDKVLAAAVQSTKATKKLLQQYTRKLQATPFSKITYVRNNAGDIDMDNIDNISVYPDSLEADSRLTNINGYLPTSATPLLPESIRIAQVRIEKEQKRMRQRRNGHNRRYA